MSISARLAALCERPVTDADRRRAVAHVVDWLGCAAIGSSADHAPALWVGSGLLNVEEDPWQELLYEASLGNIFEMDDVHRTSLVHPGSVVVPASLFLARHLPVSGSDVLSAIVRGYEAMIRFGRAVGPAHYALQHNTATCGVLGAAAAACSLLKVDQSIWVDAFGHAVTQAAGLWQVRLEPCMAKQWHVARATQTGVQAALYARAGVTGPRFIFEGEKGYFKANCPDGDVGSIVSGGDDPWCVYETSFKPWPACRHAHPAIDAALAVRKKLLPPQLLIPMVTATKVAAWLIPRLHEVRVTTYADAIAFCDNQHPASPAASRFSIQHAVAVALLGGEPGLDDFDSLALTREHTCRIREKVCLNEDVSYTDRYPSHFGAALQISLADKTLFEADVTNALGDPERPVTLEAIHQKAKTLMRHARWSGDDIRFQVAACTALSDDSTRASRVKAIKACADNA